MQEQVNKLTNKVNLQKLDNYKEKDKVLRRLAPNFYTQTEQAADAEKAAPSHQKRQKCARRRCEPPPKHLSAEDDDSSLCPQAKMEDNLKCVWDGGNMSSASNVSYGDEEFEA